MKKNKEKKKDPFKIVYRLEALFILAILCWVYVFVINKVNEYRMNNIKKDYIVPYLKEKVENLDEYKYEITYNKNEVCSWQENKCLYNIMLWLDYGKKCDENTSLETCQLYSFDVEVNKVQSLDEYYLDAIYKDGEYKVDERKISDVTNTESNLLYSATYTFDMGSVKLKVYVDGKVYEDLEIEDSNHKENYELVKTLTGFDVEKINELLKNKGDVDAFIKEKVYGTTELNAALFTKDE